METNFCPQVALFTGSFPPAQKDGVGAYVKKLHESIGKISDIHLLHQPIESNLNWKLNSLNPKEKVNLFHIQYPCEGWGNSVLPGFLPIIFSLLGFRAKIITTFHEWKAMHILRKASILPLALFSKELIFVSKQEKTAFEKSWLNRLIPKKTHYIPIGVNLSLPRLKANEILQFRNKISGEKIEKLLIHFGFLYEAKQPKKILYSLKNLIERGVKAKLILIGDYPEDKIQEKQKFLELIEELNLREHIDFLGFVEDENLIAHYIAACDAVFGLYNDGLSFRRGSFWYAAQLGCHIITTEIQEQSEFEGYEKSLKKPHINFVPIDVSAEDLANLIYSFPKYEPLRYSAIQAPDWNYIAKKHLETYAATYKES